MQIASRITDATVSGGAGPLTLLGTPLPGTRSVVSAYTAGTGELPLTIVDSITGAWESSYCTIGAGGIISRDVQIETSAGTLAPINFAAGTTKQVYLDTPITIFERTTPYSPNIPLDGRYDMGVHVVTAPIAFSPIVLNERRGSYCKLLLVMDGSSAITFPGFVAVGSNALLTAAGSFNDIEFRFNGVVATYAITHAIGAGTPPGAVTGVTVGTPTTNALPLSWTAPTTGDTPITYSVGYRVTTVGGAYTVFASGLTGTTTTITGLTPSTGYDVIVTPSNGSGNGTPGTSTGTTASGATVPGAPTIGTATAGDTTASVTFTPPGSNGGSAITGYVVTASTGQTASGSASPITVTGLTDGTAVTFTVKAVNAIGQSVASAASNSVTPTAGVDTKPGFFLGAIGSTSAAIVAGRTDLASATNGGKAGTATIPNTASGQYVFFAALTSAGTPTFHDNASNFNGGFSPFGTFTDGNSNAWTTFKSDYANAYPSGGSITLS